ncbi:hypothetical protein K503DRAFT_295883 [Rhizopogon vinicolor AM-OR11-026]|uniref:Uncharacterized protein n=1 Tax=Rhizopogon vinicolor AM-OR11-026 TaxID=1314800 RepID=A0A1B7MVB9_9AGAM|nr:hypothetical protein K503DRAFT_295883 [Rhizopogon vinicolor AM-OR11-026]
MSLSEGPDLLSDDFITLYYYDIIDPCMAKSSCNCLIISPESTVQSLLNARNLSRKMDTRTGDYALTKYGNDPHSQYLLSSQSTYDASYEKLHFPPLFSTIEHRPLACQLHASNVIRPLSNIDRYEQPSQAQTPSASPSVSHYPMPGTAQHGPAYGTQ